MKTLAHAFGRWLGQSPGDLCEHVTPWIFATLGALFLVVMFYAWFFASDL